MNAEPIHWQPITGCSFASPGCNNCHALKLSAGVLRDHPSRAGLVAEDESGRPLWAGKVRLNEEWIERPIGLRESSHIAVNTHGDLFHEAIPDEWIDRVLGVIERTPQHYYEILTKRPARMRAVAMLRGPFPEHVALGTSAERMREARQRIPHLLATQTKGRRFLVFYPLLEPIDLRAVLGPSYSRGTIAALMIGGEPERPLDPIWAASLMADCASLGIPYGTAKPKEQTAGQAVNEL